MKLGRMRDLGINTKADPQLLMVEQALDWVESGKAYAYIKPRSGLENFVGMQIQDKITHDIRMRYRADLVPNNRLVLEEGETTRRFQIRAVINVEKKEIGL